MRRITIATTFVGALMLLASFGAQTAHAIEPEDYFPTPCEIFPHLCVEVGPVEGPTPGTVAGPALPEETSDALAAPIVDIVPLAPLPPEVVVADEVDERIPDTAVAEPESPSESPTPDGTSEGPSPEAVDHGDTTDVRSSSGSSAPNPDPVAAVTPQADTEDSSEAVDEEVEPAIAESIDELTAELAPAEMALVDPESGAGPNPLTYGILGALATALLAGAVATGFALGRRNH